MLPLDLQEQLRREVSIELCKVFLMVSCQNVHLVVKSLLSPMCRTCTCKDSCSAGGVCASVLQSFHD